LLDYAGIPPREFYMKHHLLTHLIGGGIFFLEDNPYIGAIPNTDATKFGYKVEREFMGERGYIPHKTSHQNT